MPIDKDFDYEDLDGTKVGVEASPSAAPGAPSDRPYLIVLAGPNVGEMFPIASDEAFVGRSESATIRLRDDSVSRKHARIVVAGGAVRIEDLGSVNGTMVNGARVASHALEDGDKIQVGATTILKFSHHDKLEEEFQRKMLDAALRDPLTGTFNKKHLLDRLPIELAFARRHQTPLALVMSDIDHFKHINDTYGHIVGDRVLAKLAATMQAIVRIEDLLARYGGEEFALVCRGTTALDAGVVAERIRAAVAQTVFNVEDRAIPVTISAGVAAYPDVAAVQPEDLVRAADEALYEAKRAGRNRVVVWGKR